MKHSHATLCILLLTAVCVSGREFNIFEIAREKLSSFPLLIQRLLEKIIGPRNHIDYRTYAGNLGNRAVDNYPDHNMNMYSDQPAISSDYNPDNVDKDNSTHNVDENVSSRNMVGMRHIIDAPWHCPKGQKLSKLGKCRTLI